VWFLSFIDLPALVLLITANSTPVIVARLLGKRWSAPIDAHAVLRDRLPLLGPHKTWRGLVAGVTASALVGALLPPGLLLGVAFGALSLFGDLCSSFLKRRLDCESGRSVPLLDQLPEALLPLVILADALDLTREAIIGTTLLFTVLDLIVATVWTTGRVSVRAQRNGGE
jgi:CDP-2,3-bis-(O-geranylgeranyl)-sn-glycerol synthase